MSIASSVIALVTGAASGLGRATAARILRDGGRVAIVDLPTSGGERVAEELVKENPNTSASSSGAQKNVFFCPTDITGESSVSDTLQRIESTFDSPPNVVINCAGIAIAKKTIGKGNIPHPLEEFTRVLQVNTIGTFNVIRLAAARMATRPTDSYGQRGVIVNTASIAAFDGQIGQTAYAASKGAIVALTLPLARELGQFGIRVCTIAPGVFMTPMAQGLPPKVLTEMGAQVPFPPRLGNPDEFAQLVMSIIQNPFLNGETIRLDGALRMRPS